jgi:predicted glycoside hydrolase/deacetylase ChbG (UPF0249 family)
MGNFSMNIITFLLCLFCIGVSTSFGQMETQENKSSEKAETTYLIIRTDDAGMSHSANMGLKKLLDTGLPVSVSIMFPCPWYQEAVSIIKEYPENVTAGIHLTLNSEWQYYRWGPVTGQESVPSLVDKNGHFFHSSDDVYNNNPDMEEVEKELRAQIERALASGLDIDYVDYHMGTVINHPDFRKVVEKLAEEYKLGMFGYFGETSYSPHYRAAPKSKVDSLVAMIPKLEPGYNYLVTHVGINNQELGALKDMNADSPLANMAANRQGELDALTSKKFRKAIQKSDVKLITYEELIEMEGLDSMKSPFPLVEEE